MATRLWLLLLGVVVLLGTSTGCRAADIESDLALVQTLFDRHGIRDAVRCNTSRITCALNETGGDYVRELSVHRTHAHPLHTHTHALADCLPTDASRTRRSEPSPTLTLVSSRGSPCCLPPALHTHTASAN